MHSFSKILTCSVGFAKIGKSAILRTPLLKQYQLINAAPRFNFSTEKEQTKKQQQQQERDEEEEPEQKTEEKPTKEQQAAADALAEKALPNTIEELLKVNNELASKKIVVLFNQLKEQKAKLETQYKIITEEKISYANQTAQWQEKSKEMKKIVENTLSDMESMRLRLEKEKDQTKVFAITKFAGEILEVTDNIQRALLANKDLPDKETNTLYEGTIMTQKILEKILQRNGVTQLNPEGEKFDPNFHDALCQVPDQTKEAGSVAFVAQFGYKIQERVLRPAKVGVTYKP